MPNSVVLNIEKMGEMNHSEYDPGTGVLSTRSSAAFRNVGDIGVSAQFPRRPDSTH